MAQIGVALDLAEHGDAVQLGHDDVEQDDVRRLVGEQLQRLTPVPCGGDRVAVAFETVRQQQSVDRIVLNHQNCPDGRAHCKPPNACRLELVSYAGELLFGGRYQ